MKPAEAVAVRVKKLLLEQKKTQYRLAKDTCLDRTTIQKMIKGKTNDVNFTSICLFAEFFDMTLEEFFADEIFDRNNLDY